MLVLGIETSCDETALALVADGKEVVATQVASSLKSHQRYGGVVPEIASRAHVELFTYELEALLSAARISGRDLDRVAVTRGPGLPGSLVVGVAAAKALSAAWRKPVIGVNHLQAHLYAALMKMPGWSVDAPMIGLVISGGHTALVRMDGIWKFHMLGQTRDDAVGEAFDKVAKLLGLGFPGGPEIERTAQSGNSKAYRFTVPRIKSGSAYDFSLSGIKTAVFYKIQEIQGRPIGRTPAGANVEPARQLDPQFVADMSASFQASIVEEVVMKSVSACRSARIRRLAVGGGVIANTPLRERLQEVCADLKIELAIPPMSLCTDNGAMVGGLAFHLNPVALAELSVIPDLPVELN